MPCFSCSHLQPPPFFQPELACKLGKDHLVGQRAQNVEGHPANGRQEQGRQHGDAVVGARHADELLGRQSIARVQQGRRGSTQGNDLADNLRTGIRPPQKVGWCPKPGQRRRQPGTFPAYTIILPSAVPATYWARQRERRERGERAVRPPTSPG
eukprot:364096-Chlamydomonas_euryale.AAC.8